MAQDMLRRAIASGKPYDDLPARYKEAISPYEWRIRCEASHHWYTAKPTTAARACVLVLGRGCQE